MSTFNDWQANRAENGRPKDPEQSRMHDELERVWQAAASTRPPDPRTAAAWTAVRARLEETPPAPAWQGWLRPALALAAVLVAALALWIWLRPDAPRALTAERGERQVFALADGSTVELNADSRIEIAPAFGETSRDLRLAGEAYFDVRPGALPFRVRTEAATIEVKGTRFNVYARDGRTKTTVEEGVVLVTGLSPDKAVELRAGEYAECLVGGDPSQPAALARGGRPDWLDGKLVMDGESLANVCAEIERRFNVAIVFEDRDLALETVSGMLAQKSAEDMVSAICILLNQSYRRQGETFIIQ